MNAIVKRYLYQQHVHQLVSEKWIFWVICNQWSLINGDISHKSALETECSWTDCLSVISLKTSSAIRIEINKCHPSFLMWVEPRFFVLNFFQNKLNLINVVFTAEMWKETLSKMRLNATMHSIKRKKIQIRIEM